MRVSNAAASTAPADNVPLNCVVTPFATNVITILSVASAVPEGVISTILFVLSVTVVLVTSNDVTADPLAPVFKTRLLEPVPPETEV